MTRHRSSATVGPPSTGPVVLADSWRNATGAIDALIGHRIAGRAVLYVD